MIFSYLKKFDLQYNDASILPLKIVDIVYGVNKAQIYYSKDDVSFFNGI